MASHPAGRPNAGSSRPGAAPQQGGSNDGASTAPVKKKKHRGGKKKRNRRQSFAAPSESTMAGDMANDSRPSLADNQARSHHSGRGYRRNSNTSLESEALLDHRDEGPMQARRNSQVPQIFTPRPSHAYSSPSRDSASRPTQNIFGRSKLANQAHVSESENEDLADDRTPLMNLSQRDIRTSGSYGGTQSSGGRRRRDSRDTNESILLRPALIDHRSTLGSSYDVNNPPSVPGSPSMGPDVDFDDVMMAQDLEHGLTHAESRDHLQQNKNRDMLIDIDEDATSAQRFSPGTSPKGQSDLRRRMTLGGTEDVCIPLEGMSEMGEHDYMHQPEGGEQRGRRRRRRWPDLGILEAWSREEKEQRTMEGLRSRKVSEPLMVGGRLRPQKRPWHKEADDAPYRFTYFNEEFENTIHSQTISELVQDGQTFRDLFIPNPPVIEDSSGDETDEDMEPPSRDHRSSTPQPSGNGHSRTQTESSARLGEFRNSPSGEHTGTATPALSMRAPTPKPDQEKPKRYGPRPAFWLDVLSPTDAEMKAISKAFSIHPLTAEDILMQEAREKVELFKHYYFINYRTFEQDENNEDYLEPVNLYVVVFREGVISFHFSMTPHPANVRRRIRQLQDYLILSPDWISYGIIDDITDAYAPLIEKIEDEVDDIDEAILRLHSEEEEQEQRKQQSASYNDPHYEKTGDTTNGRDMLRRVGECRKKVMGLYRLLGNKADVIKGFAKRCNEQWDVAPRSEIGLYLGDIQDHIVTMTGNLSHYEK